MKFLTCITVVAVWLLFLTSFSMSSETIAGIELGQRFNEATLKEHFSYVEIEEIEELNCRLVTAVCLIPLDSLYVPVYVGTLYDNNSGQVQLISLQSYKDGKTLDLLNIRKGGKLLVESDYNTATKEAVEIAYK